MVLGWGRKQSKLEVSIGNEWSIDLPLLRGLELAAGLHSGARGPSEVLQDGVDPPEWNMLHSKSILFATKGFSTLTMLKVTDTKLKNTLSRTLFQRKAKMTATERWIRDGILRGKQSPESAK